MPIRGGRQDFAQPSFLCPICLHKAHRLCGFDVPNRYTLLAGFWERNDLPAEAAEASRLCAAAGGGAATAAASDGAGGGGGQRRASAAKRPAAELEEEPYLPPAPRRRARGERAAAETVDLTLLEDSGGAEPMSEPMSAEVICLHSPVRAVAAAGGEKAPASLPGAAMEPTSSPELLLREQLARRMEGMHGI